MISGKNYSLTQKLSLFACTSCRICEEVCPAVGVTGNRLLSGTHRINIMKRLLLSRAGIIGRLLGGESLSDEKLKEFSEQVFRCTLCGNCEESCPMGISLTDMWTALRGDLVQSKSYPEKIDRIRDNIEESHNVFGEDNEERAEWVEDMDEPPDDGLIRERAETVYFTGCVAGYFPLAQKIPVSFAEILQGTGTDFTLLGGDEWCCGFPLLGAGLMDLFNEVKEHNINAVKQKGAKKLVFTCPSCYRMWQEYYSAEVEIMHSSEFLLELLNKGILKLKPLKLKVIYHDPCDLGRGAGIFDEPRKLISAIPGVQLLEFPENRERCKCCGGGGNLEMIDNKLSSMIASNKIAEAMSLGVDAVVTACQQCVRTMTTYVRRNKVPLKIYDITEFIYKAADIPSDD